MGRNKTKYTKSDACIYILYCVMNNQFNTLESLSCCLELTFRQIKRYIFEINLAMDDFMLGVKVVYNRSTGRYFLK